jgi:high-affinity iron transporter
MTNKIKKYLLLNFLIILLSIPVLSQKIDESTQIRNLISLLDYIASDYHNAVENGKIINNNEYKEITEFAEKVDLLFVQSSVRYNISNSRDFKIKIQELNLLIKNKKNKELIFQKANLIKTQIIKLNLISISPNHKPNIVLGAKIFKANCENCHGNKADGNGINSANLTPKPTNLTNDTIMQKVSAFQIFNTVRLGIAGTSMVAVDRLTDQEVWDVAYYVNSIRHKDKINISNDSIVLIYSQLVKYLSVSNISSLSDIEMIKLLKPENGNLETQLHVLRSFNPSSQKENTIIKTSVYLDDILELYKANNYQKASEIALSAYLECVEPAEKQLNAIDPKLKKNIESLMFQLRADIKNKVPLANLEQNIKKLNKLIYEASSLLSNKEYSFWFAFLMAASIILREGLEAILIIITILGVLKSLKAKDAIKWVHFGWISALIVGIISMFYINLLVSLGTESRELIEGVGSALAVILLLYIGFWLHSKTEAQRWKEFVESKIIRLLNSSNMIGLFTIAFIVVFREAFESAIFLSTINIEASQTSNFGIYYGALSSLAVVFVFAWIVLKTSSKLPIVKLFKYSAVIMSAFSLVLTGKCIFSLQEIGYAGVTKLPFDFEIPLLGFYSNLESFIAQLVVLTIIISLWNYNNKRTIKVL